jgi:hypothetical protein
MTYELLSKNMNSNIMNTHISLMCMSQSKSEEEYRVMKPFYAVLLSRLVLLS